MTDGWKSRLGATPPPADEVPFTRLGLLFQLRTLTREGSQWTAPKAEPATAVRRRGTQRLAVRPVILGGKGSWITSEVTWSSLGHKVERLNLNPAHVAWFSQFAALHRAASETYRASETDWLYLDDFASPLLWPHLAAARADGITFVSGKQAEKVTLADPADITLEIGREGGSASLRVQTEILVSGVDVTPTGFIGNHGVYVCRFSGGLHVQLAEANPDALRYVDIEQPVTRIPVGDLDEFWDDHYPTLALRTPVRGAGVKLPEIVRQTVLVVTVGQGDRLDLSWQLWTGPIHEPLSGVAPVVVPEKLEGADAAEWVTRELPALRTNPDFNVEVFGTLPDYRELTDPPELRFVAVPEEGNNDWLDLGFVIVVGEYTVPFANVFRALSRGKNKVKLVDNTWFTLDHPVFDALKELIAEGETLREWETGAIVSRYRADFFEPFEDESDHTPAAIAWRAAARALTTAPPETSAPDGLVAELRPYQLAGFQWLAHLWQHHLGGILADDMGLGKTLQAIALMRHAITQNPGEPWLVVAPTSVIGSWLDELKRFAPGLRVAAVRGTKDVIPVDVDIVVTSYALFRLEFDRYQYRSFAGAFFDEAQYLKNGASQVHECAEALHAPVKFALTGTPLENSLLDLWALLRVTSPGLYPSRIRFTDRYVKAHSDARVAELRRRIRPMLLRRTKRAVALELPEKQEHIVMVDLDPAHRALYDRYLQRERQKLLGLVDDIDRNRFIVFRSLTLLRRLALDPRLIEAEDTEGIPSSKLDELIDRMTDLAAEGHRALVFSQFTSYLALVRDRLDERGIEYQYLDGATTQRDRVIADFREGYAPAFLISLRAGGVGLTLTEADTVFLLDPWWNPAAENQAIDRTHRIGQDDPVFVYRLVARDTIEEKVLALSDTKRALFDEVIDNGDTFSSALTADEIRSLLA